MRHQNLDGQQVLLLTAEGRSSQSIGSAMLTLNLLGIAVDLDGCITIQGEKVAIRVERGAVVAVVDGTSIPWALFRRTLPTRRTAA